MQVEMKMFKNVDGKKRELTDQMREFEEKQKSLKSVLAVTASAVDDAKKRLAQFEVCRLLEFVIFVLIVNFRLL